MIVTTDFLNINGSIRCIDVFVLMLIGFCSFVFISLIMFLTFGIILIGPANILCIVSNFLYSFYTLYFFTFQLDNGVT